MDCDRFFQHEKGFGIHAPFLQARKVMKTLKWFGEKLILLKIYS